MDRVFLSTVACSTMPYLQYIYLRFHIHISWGGANLVSNLRVICFAPSLSRAFSIRASTGGSTWKTGRANSRAAYCYNDLLIIIIIIIIRLVACPLLKYSAVSILFPRRTRYFTTNGITLPCNINSSRDIKSTISVRHAVRNTRGFNTRSRFNEIGGSPGDNGHGIRQVE